MKEFTDKTYFSALTGLRAIAAYMVFIHHYNVISVERFGFTLSSMSKELHVGVTIFFVLSGFLIGYRYLNDTTINFRSYIVNRFARVYPMYFLLTSFTFLVYAALKGRNGFSDFAIYLTNITFIRGYFEDLKFTGVGPGWSLTVEETFYFMAPLFFVLIKKSKWNLLSLPLILISFGCLYNRQIENSDF